MKKMTRSDCPEWLAENKGRWTQAYCQRRENNPAASFSWPQRNGKKINHDLKEELGQCTAGHCSYCDGGFPLGSASRDTIDHFKPKESYCTEAFTWENLYLACDCCQQAKGSQYSELLLRPDSQDFNFSSYFQFNYRNGDLEPNPLASEEKQQQAVQTIKLLGLNQYERPRARLSELKKFSEYSLETQYELLEDFNYRFILIMELDSTSNTF